MINYVEMKNIMASWLNTSTWHSESLHDQEEFQEVLKEFETIGIEDFDFTLFEEIVREKISIDLEHCNDEYCDNLLDGFRGDLKNLMN